MSMSATALANSMIEDEESDIEELQVHEFPDDTTAHDEAAIQGLYQQFNSDFDDVSAELSVQYGDPAYAGDVDTDAIPLNGVFRYAIWNVEGKHLFLAAAHEDRGTPIVLMLGTTASV